MVKNVVDFTLCLQGGVATHIKRPNDTHTMRTNIVIDDELIANAMKASGAPTKKAAVDEALRLLIRIKAQQELKSLRGKIKWEGYLDAMRLD